MADAAPIKTVIFECCSGGGYRHLIIPYEPV